MIFMALLCVFRVNLRSRAAGLVDVRTATIVLLPGALPAVVQTTREDRKLGVWAIDRHKAAWPATSASFKTAETMIFISCSITNARIFFN
jgi:hypothetical protein